MCWPFFADVRRGSQVLQCRAWDIGLQLLLGGTYSRGPKRVSLPHHLEVLQDSCLAGFFFRNKDLIQNKLPGRHQVHRMRQEVRRGPRAVRRYLFGRPACPAPSNAASHSCVPATLLQDTVPRTFTDRPASRVPREREVPFFRSLSSLHRSSPRRRPPRRCPVHPAGRHVDAPHPGVLRVLCLKTRERRAVVGRTERRSPLSTLIVKGVVMIKWVVTSDVRSQASTTHPRC